MKKRNQTEEDANNGRDIAIGMIMGAVVFCFFIVLLGPTIITDSTLDKICNKEHPNSHFIGEHEGKLVCANNEQAYENTTSITMLEEDHRRDHK